MKDEKNEKKVVPVFLFFLPGVLFMLTSLIPLIKGRPLNVVFFALSITWFLLGLAMVKNARKKIGESEPGE